MSSPSQPRDKSGPDSLNTGPDSLIQMGKFGRPHGVHGWTSVVSFSDPIDNILTYLPWLIGPPLLPFKPTNQIVTFEEVRLQNNKLFVKLEDYNDRDQAATLTHQSIYIQASQLPPLEEDEFYWHQLEGLTVTNTQGIPMGIIEYVFNSGANDILCLKQCPSIEGYANRRERLVPYTDDVIVSIDINQKTMVVDWHPDD